MYLTLITLAQCESFNILPTGSCSEYGIHISVDDKILQHMIDSQAEFIMEVTDKTKADIKVAPFVILTVQMY